MTEKAMTLAAIRRGDREAEKEARALLRVIAALAERSYRRGYHHGVSNAVTRGFSDLVAVARWRFAGKAARRKSVPPPGAPCPFRSTAMDRLVLETQSDGERDALCRLFRAAGMKFGEEP